MRYSLLLICCCFALPLYSAATPPYDKTTVPWSVYLPSTATDTTGTTDANISLHGDDIHGWHTFMVFQDSGGGVYTHITNNVDLYTGTTPNIVRSDYEGTTTASNGYLIIKFNLIQPANTPSVNTAESSYIDTATGNLSFGHEEHALGYGAVEAKVENVTMTGDYWLCADEVPQKLWKAIYGDKLYDTASIGSLKDDIENFLGNNSDSTTDNDNLALQHDAADYVDDEMAMHSMTWTECQTFFTRFSAFTGGKTTRLPNEYEWEYAARAGMDNELPMSIIAGNRSWSLVDPSDNVSVLSITDVFDKTHHPKDIPDVLIEEVVGSTHVGNNPDGTQILENKIVKHDYEIDPRLEATANYRMIIGLETNYDIRYPARLAPLKVMLKKARTDRDGFMSVELDGTEIDDNIFREYYNDEKALAHAVTGLYMPVDSSGVYAATFNGTYYVYDETKVHHFEQITGREVTAGNVVYNIWPNNRDGAMTVDNTVLTYMNWVSYDEVALTQGKPYANLTSGSPAEAEAANDAKNELLALVRNQSYGNSPGDYVENTVYIKDSSTVAEDMDLKRRLLSKDIKDAIAGNINHNWYWCLYVLAGHTSGDGIRNYTLDGGATTVPIDNIGAHESPALVGPVTNDWGFANMSGNVAEFCIPRSGTNAGDRWDGVSNYEHHRSGDWVVTRGGSWNSPAIGVRYADRSACNPANRSPEIGFRILIEQ